MRRISDKIMIFVLLSNLLLTAVGLRVILRFAQYLDNFEENAKCGSLQRLRRAA